MTDKTKLDALAVRPIVPTADLATWLADVAAERWSWVRNTKCKYVTLKIDTRRGAYCIEDRDGNKIDLIDLTEQYGRARSETNG
jgi:hypothetical protein